MFGFAVTSDQYDRQAISRASGWTREHPRGVGLANFGCGILGVFAAAQLPFENDVTGTYTAFRLALLVVGLGTICLVDGYDDLFIGSGSYEFCKVLDAGGGSIAAMAVLSYVINLELARSYALIALPPTTLLVLLTPLFGPVAAVIWLPDRASVSALAISRWSVRVRPSRTRWRNMPIASAVGWGRAGTDRRTAGEPWPRTDRWLRTC